MEKILAGLILFVGFIALTVFLGALLALPVMWLWNGALVGAVSGVSHIGWMQAWGISILASILFKNSSVKTNND